RDDLYILETRDHGQTWQTLHAMHDDAALRKAPVSVDRFRDMVRTALATYDEGPTTEVQLDRVMQAAVRNNCRGTTCVSQFDYPYVIRASNGDIHILYSWKKSLIAHAWWRAAQQDDIPLPLDQRQASVEAVR